MKPSELLADPAAWTQNVTAEDVVGKSIVYDSPYACKWSIGGAMLKADAYTACNIEKLEALVGNFDDWNDAPERTHAEVLDVLRKCGL